MNEDPFARTPIVVDDEGWADAARARFLATLSWQLTVSARMTYEARTERVLKPELLRGFNELQHRVIASLGDYLAGRAGIPLLTAVEMVRDFGAYRGVQVEDMIARALEAVKGLSE